MKTVSIIVNYNDGKKLTEKIISTSAVKAIDAVIVVDNKSSDGSPETVESMDKVIVLRAERNGGYGYGNNIGLRYAKDVLNADYAIISNPDTDIPENCINKMLSLFSANKDLAVCAPVCRTPDSSFDVPASAWPIRSWHLELFEHGPLMRRIFHRKTHYPAGMFTSYDTVTVDAVLGSCLTADIGKVLEAGGYDDCVFLYCEENILGCKLKKHGYKTMLLCSEYYNHDHKPVLPDPEKVRILRDSELHYFRNYLEVGSFKIFISRLFFAVVYLETAICKALCRKNR